MIIIYYSKFDRDQNFIFVHMTYWLSSYRNVAEPSLYKHSTFSRVACERFLQTCRNNGATLKLKLSLLPTKSNYMSFNLSYWFLQLLKRFDNPNVVALMFYAGFENSRNSLFFGDKTRLLTIRSRTMLSSMPCEYEPENQF